MKKLILVRHGQASAGEEDYDRLSPLGHIQAEKLGIYLKNRDIVPEQILTGSLTRHRQTADGIIKSFKIDIGCRHEDKSLNEFGPEIWQTEGEFLLRNDESFAKLAEAYDNEHEMTPQHKRRKFMALTGRVLKSWVLENRMRNRPDTENSFESFQKLILSESMNAIRNLLNRTAENAVAVVVSSGTPIAILISIFESRNQQPEALTVLRWMRSLHNTAFCEIDFENLETYEIKEANCTDHLDQNEITLI